MSSLPVQARVLRWLWGVYMLLVFGFMLGAAVVYWPEPELAFRSDHSPVAWLSSAQLWALMVLSLRLTVELALPRALGLWLFVALAALSLDEQFMLHEHWKYGCQVWLSACEHAWVRDLPMGMVGLGGVVTALALHQVLRPRAQVLLWAAIGVGLWALSMDLVLGTGELAPYEEAFEVLAEALFLSCLLCLPSPGRTPHFHSCD